MDALCEKVEAFADGRLPPVDARAFTEHLATCAHCQARLTGLMQLDELGRQYVKRHGSVMVPWYTSWRARWGAAGLVIAFVAMVLVVMAALRRDQRPDNSGAQLWARARTQEERVTYPPADVHRPRAQRLMGGSSGDEAPVRTPALEAALDARGDLRQLAALYLAEGKPDPERARRVLQRPEAQRLWEPADLLCDLGVTYQAEGRYADALPLFNQAIRQRPEHLQALWNRALVYRDLNLPLLAMQDFAAVERLDSEAGWRREAADHQRELSSILRSRERWEFAERAADAMVRGAPGAIDEARQFVDVPLMRRDFYDAVRVRTNDAEVRALLPLAQRLDAKAQAGNVLADYVQRVASRDFGRRAPLARRYAGLLRGQLPGASEREEFVRNLLASGEEDLAMGAIMLMKKDRVKYARDLARLAESNPDPWFKLVSLQVQADAAGRAEEHERERKLLEDALDTCQRTKLTYRCIDIENDLSFALNSLFKLDDAASHALEGLKTARSSAQWDKVGVFLRALGNVSRRRADVTLGRAYYSEALLAIGPGPDRAAEQDIHQNLAHLAILELDLAAAREQLEQVMAAGPLTIHGAEALVDVSRWQRLPHDAQMLEQALANPGDTAGQRAYATFLRGRFVVEEDAKKGRALLESAIREAEASGDGGLAKHARTYSYTSLIFDDAKRGDFEAALRRFGAELGFEVPARCVLALTEDTERSLIVARGADGRLLRAHDLQRTKPLPIADMRDVVPGEMVAALEPCAQVDVLVRPPLQGRPGLLPPGIAWRYRSRPAPPRPPEGRGLYLVVNEVHYDRRDLRPLHWTPSTGGGAEVRMIQGLEATPGRVSDEMRSATEIDLATHGITSPTSNASRLVLARDVDGLDELREDRIRGLRLLGAPLVVLAACEAARGAPELHELAGLPYAFLSAGARAVIAATLPIPDGDSSSFFGAVRARIRAGATTSAAVRDERMEWIRQDKGTEWIRSVLVFE